MLTSLLHWWYFKLDMLLKELHDFECNSPDWRLHITHHFCQLLLFETWSFLPFWCTPLIDYMHARKPIFVCVINIRSAFMFPLSFICSFSHGKLVLGLSPTIPNIYNSLSFSVYPRLNVSQLIRVWRELENTFKYTSPLFVWFFYC